MNRVLLVTVAFVVALGAACARNDPGRPRVRLAVGGQAQMVYLPTTLAQELGFYREEGLDVELQDFPGGAKALQALVGGSADVVSGFYDHTIQMAAEGRELVAFVTILRYPGLVLVTSPQAAGSVSAVGQLRGKVAGVTTPGSSSQMLLSFLLTKYQVPIDSVSVVTIGSAATAIAAIERGKVDAGWMADPSFTLVKKRNPSVKVLADLRDERGTMEALGTRTYPASVFYSTRAWIDAHRDAAARLARAMLRTLQWMHTHSPQDIAEKTPKALRGEDDALFVEALGNSMPMFSSNGVMTPDGAEAVRTLLAGSMEKVKRATIDLSRTYTNEFVTTR
ncbi:MAG TPA: ABC transporter substrate-binding protein [Vicinamibacterales bacterium]|jgi:NitT/TauT family transport system substrate-binding protein|nr:ABC transporter substrate-binding protein [Vicinamibacterales bacterium]